MKRMIGCLFVAQIFILGVAVQAAEDNGRDDKKKENESLQSTVPVRKAPAARKAPATRAAHPAPQPIAIHRDLPAQKARAADQPAKVQALGAQAKKEDHRPSNTLAFDRQKLSRMGIKAPPARITNRSSILHADRSHSAIGYPRSGPRGERIRGSLVSPRNFNNGVVRAQMSIVIRPSYGQRLNQERNGENQRNHYYWHSDNGFNYNHYVDYSGYHWYGWYMGDQYFWTRNYEGRWWWYDPDYDRWCYYNDNHWWWQDPHYQDELYVYDNGGYLSASFNSGN